MIHFLTPAGLALCWSLGLTDCRVGTGMDLGMRAMQATNPEVRANSIVACLDGDLECELPKWQSCDVVEIYRTVDGRRGRTYVCRRTQ